MTLKRKQVVMLPTNEKAIKPLLINPSTGKMKIIKHPQYLAGEYQKVGYKTFHLHILSDEKIIATTDASLNLPQPSDLFISKYVEEHNKGNVITEVMVEYEEIIVNQSRLGLPNIIESVLKVNLKDNTITIKKVKDSWTREEVIKFAEKYARMVQEKEIQLNTYKSIHNQKWIEENL